MPQYLALHYFTFTQVSVNNNSHLINTPSVLMERTRVIVTRLCSVRHPYLLSDVMLLVFLTLGLVLYLSFILFRIIILKDAT